MSRSRNKKRKQNSEKCREKRAAAAAGDLVKETAGRFTCLYEVTQDFTYQCQNTLEDLETDIDFNQVAHDLWQSRPGKAEALTGALADFLVERRRYLAALKVLEPRFRALLDPPDHEHLDPVEKYYEQIHRGLFPHEFDPPPVD